MPVLNVCLCLMTEMDTPAPMQATSYWRSYFIDGTTGASRYWSDVSLQKLSFTGDVFGWMNFDTEPDFSNRSDIARKAIETVTALRGDGKSVENDYDLMVVFLVRANGAGSGAGFHPIASKRLSGCVVVDTNSQFDYVVHEVGHGLRLNHSYDDSPWIWDPGNSEHPGEYGHRYCVMSAMNYGNTNPTFLVPNQPTELQRDPPGVNGWESQARGWARVARWDRASMPRIQVELEPLTGPAGGKWKVVHFVGASGGEYAVSFRSRQQQWDRALPSDLLLLEQGKQGQAAKVQGDGGTLLKEIRLPMNISMGQVNRFTIDGAIVEVLDYTGLSVLVRFSDDPAPTFLSPEGAALEILSFHQTERRESQGTFDFAAAGVHCAPEGAWAVTRVSRAIGYRARLEAPEEWIRLQPITWEISGSSLVGDSGSVTVQVDTDVPLPLPSGIRGTAAHTLQWVRKSDTEVVFSHGGGEGDFTVEVKVIGSFSVGQMSFSESVRFTSEEIELPAKFNEGYKLCMRLQAEKSRAQRKLIIPKKELPRPPYRVDHALLRSLEAMRQNPLEHVVHRMALAEATGFSSTGAHAMEIDQSPLSEDALRRSKVLDHGM